MRGCKKLKIVMMRMLLFMLQHQFVHVPERCRDGRMGKHDFCWQKEGFGTGSSASGPIADITVLVGERILLEKLDGETTC